MPQQDKQPDELSGWKEISAYFGVDKRTAQKWEKERGLPVNVGGDPEEGSPQAEKNLIGGKRQLREARARIFFDTTR